MDKVVDHILVFHGDARIQNFPGNYSQYREWKIEEDKRGLNENKTIRAESIDSRKKNEVKTKLTFKERREFESLEHEIEKLEEDKDLLSDEISSGKLSTDELLNKSKHN